MKNYKKQLEQSLLVSIHNDNDSYYAIPKRIITEKEKEILIEMIKNLPCEKI